MARWLALGALARTQGENLSLFEAAHMGWDRYEQLYTKLRVTEDMIKPYHLLRTNPFDAARKLRGIFGCDYDGAVLLVPDNKHYSWEKAVRLIGLGDDAFWPVELDARGKLDVADLDRKIRKARQLQRPVLMVVSVAGTTEMGDFDPIDEVADLLDVFAAHDGINLWHHVDAAYGGFFCAINREETAELSGAMKKALAAIGRSQSLTVDPHKLGFVPYASGAFLCANTREYRAHHIQAPYLDLSRKEDKGPQTIEGSRSAAGAVSTWLTSKIIGLDGDGYGRILARTIRARIRVQELLKQSDTRFRIAPHGETNILCFCFARDYEPVSVTNRRTQQLYEHFSTRENRDFFVSGTTLTFGAYSKYLDGFLKEWNGQVDESGLTLIRITVLNPFFSSRETGVDYAHEFVNAVCAVLDRS
jgi:glutamate/tyrosine decarboxylase-like PLP-dependent enzyme